MAWSRWSGTAGRGPAHARSLATQPLGDHSLRGGPGERRLAGEHLVQHAAERVDVAPGIDRLAAACSGLMYGRRAERQAGLGQRCSSARLLERLGDAEVGDQRAARLVSRMFSGLMSRWTMPWPCA